MRNIEPALVAWFDKKLEHNGLVWDAVYTKKPRIVFVAAAESCIGIREKGGNNNGPMVKLFQETINRAEREAWCMSFVQSCLAYAELKTGIKSPVAAGEHCLSVFYGTPAQQRVRFKPLRGAIPIWKRGAGPSGHTGVYLEPENGYRDFYAVEGNTEAGLKPDGSIEREGGGVYPTLRSMVRNGNMSIVGFLKPF